MLCWRLWFAIH